jgi:ubiquitin carboxyl-terminal hydrolase 47
VLVGMHDLLSRLLQTLFMTPEFRRVLYSWRYDPSKDDDKADCIPYQLQLLFAQLQLTEQRSISTTV